MSCDFLREPLVITCEAENALWAHHCLATPNKFGRILDWLPMDDGTLAIRFEDVQLDGSTDKESGSRIQVARLDDQYKHVKEIVEHSHQISLRFLSSFYDITDAIHRRQETIQNMFTDFSSAWSRYKIPHETLEQPNGHVAWLIIRCIDDIKNTGYCDTITVDTQFTIDWEHERICTTAYLLVRDDTVKRVIGELSFWSLEEFKRANLDVIVMSDAASLPSD
ncbi:hypothetical protein VNI00_017101 [Paramarasmius palmivorus]|uniref:Uncharacterized protein n=1 Tax=Paramarasmius palmivorus TaxID=297713 RepID=A0AAW0B706_9AGAR